MQFTSSFSGRTQDLGDREWSAAVQKVFVSIASTILYYEYIQTFSREVAWIWKAPRQLSWLNILFYVNRYLILLGQSGVLLRAFWPGPLEAPNRLEICKALTLYHQFFGAAVQFVVEAFMIVRVSAMYNFSRRVTAFLLLVGIGAITNAVVSVSTSKEVQHTVETIPLNSCMLPNDDYNAHRLAIAWAGGLALDIIIVIFTLVKALSEPTLGKSVIVKLLLRDGTFYFAIMSLFMIATVCSWLVPDPYLRGTVSTLANVIASCLTTRLILNMRNPALFPQLQPAVIQDPAIPDTSVEWAIKKDAEESDFESDDGKTTFDLITSEGNILTKLSDEEYYGSFQERSRKREDSPV